MESAQREEMRQYEKNSDRKRRHSDDDGLTKNKKAKKEKKHKRDKEERREEKDKRGRERRRSGDKEMRRTKKSSRDSKERMNGEKNRSLSPHEIDLDWSESEDEEKKIEESRKRRQAIMQQKESQQLDDRTKCKTDEIIEIDDSLQEPKKDQKIVPKVSTQFDMFADNVEIKEIKPTTNKSLIVSNCLIGTTDGTNASLKDNWDDDEGYYRVREGELLDGRYRIAGFTGAGVFGNVVRCADVERNTTVAIKIIRSNELMKKSGLRELEFIKKLNAADKKDKMHCLRLHGSFDHHGHLCLVMENLAMNLRELLKKYGNKVGLSIESVRKFAKQLLSALRLLKDCRIVHADIKPDNILVNESRSTLKLCDFGTSGLIDEQEIAPYLVSRFYRAPEIMLGISHDYGIDLWSVAVTLYELSTGKVMFSGATNNHMLKLFAEVKGPFPNKLIKKAAFKDEHFDANYSFLYQVTDKVTGKNKISVLSNIRPTRSLADELVKKRKQDEASMVVLKQFRNLLDQMLTIDHSRRITVEEALKHSFITGG